MRERAPRCWLRLLSLPVLLLGLPGWGLRPAAAVPRLQPAGLTMQVTVGYGGTYKLGEWFPVRVDLSNSGPGTIAGQLQVEAQGNGPGAPAVFARDVTVPTPGHKQITLTTFASTFARRVEVRLVQGSTVLARQTVSVTPLEYPAVLIGVVSANAGLLNGLRDQPISNGARQTGRATVVHLDLDDLPPTAEGWNGLDALVLADVDTARLSAEARTALTGWLVRGGLLVVAEDGGGRTAAGLADLLPVAVTGSHPVGNFDPLAAYAAPDNPALAPSGFESAAAATVALLPERGATVLAGDEAAPLLAARRYGVGLVAFLALDPAGSPLRDWDGTELFWTKLLGNANAELSLGAQQRVVAGSSYPGYSYSYYYNYGTGPFPVPALQWPSAWLIGGFLLAYLLLVGPVNYLVLRARQRLELAWVTIPALIVLFAVAAYGIGVVSKGTVPRLLQTTAVRTYGDGYPATVESFTGLFSPTRGSYDFTFAAEMGLTEVNTYGLIDPGRSNPVLVAEGRPTTARGVLVDTGSLRGFLAEGVLAYTSPLTATVRLDNGRLRGEVINRGTTRLRDVAVFRGSQARQLGALNPAERRTFDLAAQTYSVNSLGPQDLLPDSLNSLTASYNYATPRTAEQRALARRAGLLGLTLHSISATDPYLPLMVVGWDAPAPFPPPVSAVGVTDDPVMLVVSEVPLTALPPGALPPVPSPVSTAPVPVLPVPVLSTVPQAVPTGGP